MGRESGGVQRIYAPSAALLIPQTQAKGSALTTPAAEADEGRARSGSGSSSVGTESSVGLLLEQRADLEKQNEDMIALLQEAGAELKVGGGEWSTSCLV